MSREKSHKFTTAYCFLFFFIVSWIMQGTQSFAQGNLILMQKRVVFEGNKTTELLEFGNFGKDTATYVVSLLHMRMTVEGSFLQVEQPDSGEFFADDYIRIYPHTIVLAPNESQTMKIQLINTENIKPGEYRSHLYFRAARNDQDTVVSSDKKSIMSVNLAPSFGISIPVIIRVGEPKTSVQLTDLGLESMNDTAQVLKFSFHRSGNFSAYGDISVAYISSKGKKTEIEKVRGVAVYTPGSVRNTRLTLKSIQGINYHEGKLIVSYTKPEEDNGTLIAQSELRLR